MGEKKTEPCFLPDFKVERIANIILLHFRTDDDSIIMLEIFKDLASGNPRWIGRAEDYEP